MILETKKIKEIIPYISSLIILCGYLKLKFYFNHFNINIVDYLEVTEILTLFIADVLHYSSIVFFIFLLQFLLERQFQKEYSEKKLNEIFETNNVGIRLIKFALYDAKLVIAIPLLIFSICIFFFSYENLNYALFFDFAFLCLFLFHFVFIEFQRKYHIVYKKQFDPTYKNLISIFSIFFAYILCSAYMDIKLRENYNDYNICFKYDKNEIKTSNNLIYIGETKNYLFMYKKNEKEASVFLRNEIDSLKIKNYR